MASSSVKDGTNILIKSKLDQDLKVLEESERRGKRATEMVKLAAMAFLHEKHGNVRGAYAAYQQLELLLPRTSEKREDNLFNLVRTSSLVAAGADTQKYGEIFLKTSRTPARPGGPPHDALLAVLRRRVRHLHRGGGADAAKLTEDTPEHDICLHVLGGSYFYTGQFDKAQPLLDQHVEKYP
jgi:hypothetical protein